MRLKRAFDVVLATCVLIVLSPVLILSAIATKLSSRGPVLHRATRVGKDGKPFTLLKFRTMRVGTTGPSITSAGDPRITAVGKVLRGLKIDELPQLINVLRGDMSLVGPRPEDPRFVERYTPEQRRVLSVRPGITSPAAVAYRNEERLIGAEGDVEALYVTKILPAKLGLDLSYVDRRSFWVDIAVLARTAFSVLKPLSPSNQGRGMHT